MNLVTHIARLLLGLVFTVFGLNGFLHFIPVPPHTGIAGQFTAALAASHYLTVVFALELIGGVLLLVNRHVPVALTLLGPIIVNIVLLHVLMAPKGLAMAVIVTALWGLVFYRHRSAFSGIFRPTTGGGSSPTPAR